MTTTENVLAGSSHNRWRMGGILSISAGQESQETGGSVQDRINPGVFM